MCVMHLFPKQSPATGQQKRKDVLKPSAQPQHHCTLLTETQNFLQQKWLFALKRPKCRWGLGHKRVERQNKAHPRDSVNKYEPCLFSSRTTTAFEPESGNQFGSLLCTNAFRVASPAPRENTATPHALECSLSARPVLFCTAAVHSKHENSRSYWPVHHAGAQPPHERKEQIPYHLTSAFPSLLLRNRIMILHKRD